MNRAAGIVFGAATQLLFAFTVWHLFWFLYGESRPPSTGGLPSNAAWAILFAIPHSVLLHPATRKRLSGVISVAFYGCFFCVVTCVTLLTLIFAWNTSPEVVFDLSGIPRILVRVGFYSSWVALFYSLALSGLGWQTGLTPWWHWVRKLPPPKRDFQPRSLYRWLRHPIYLSFLGLIWFNPRMTLDRAVLTAIWTAYIFVGSWLKDQRLLRFLGDRYRTYQQAVPGYPFFPAGPLGRIPVPLGGSRFCSDDAPRRRFGCGSREAEPQPAVANTRPDRLNQQPPGTTV